MPSTMYSRRSNLSLASRSPPSSEPPPQQLGVAHAIGCSSGTDALWLALAAAGIGPGDAVITTPFSFFASVSAILRAGATAVLADIDPVTFNLVPAAVEAALDGAAAAQRSAPFCPCTSTASAPTGPRFRASRKERGLKLIEDAAQAWGAEWNGVNAGGLGDIAAFSFYPTKNLSAAGDAGMVTTNSDDLAERARMLRQHGMRRRYHHDEMGWNARMDGFQGAILAVKLKYIDGWNEARRTVAAALPCALSRRRTGRSRPLSRPRRRPAARSCRRTSRLASIRDPHRPPRRVARLSCRTQIGSEIYYPVPLHMQEALKCLGYAEGGFPEAERAAREVLALPIFPELREDEQQTVVAAIAEFLS